MIYSAINPGALTLSLHVMRHIRKSHWELLLFINRAHLAPPEQYFTAYKLITKTMEHQLQSDPHKNNQCSWKLNDIWSNYHVNRVGIWTFEVLIYAIQLR